MSCCTVFRILTLLVVCFVFASTAFAAPPPEGVCGVCGSAFVESGEQVGIDITIIESNLTVRLTPSGDSYWTAHTTVSEATADRFDASRTLLRDIVTRTYASSRTVVDNPNNVSIARNDQTVTVTFRVPDTVHRYPGNVLLFDSFVRYPPHGEAYLDADQLAVRGPSGTVVTHAPPGGDRNDNRVVWTPETKDRTYSAQLGRDAAIVFAPNHGIMTQIATDVAVRGYTLQMLRSELRAYAFVPALVLGFVAGSLLFAGRWLQKRINPNTNLIRYLAVATGVYLGGTIVATLIVGDDLGFVLTVIGFGLAPQVLLTGLVALFVDYFDLPVNRALPHIAMASILAWTILLIVAAPMSALIVLMAGPLVFLPFGVLTAVGHWIRLVFPIVVALGPVVAALAFVPRTGAVVVSPMMLTAVILGSAVLGSILFVIGWQLVDHHNAGTVNPETTG